MDRENARRKPRLEAGGLRRAGRSEWAGFRFGWSEIRAVRACVVTSTPWSVRARAESRGGRLVDGSARLGTRVSDGRGILGRAGLEAGWDEGVRVGWADDDALFRAGGSGFAGMPGPHAAPLRPCIRERVRACRKDSGGAGIAIARNDAMQPERARSAVWAAGRATMRRPCSTRAGDGASKGQRRRRNCHCAQRCHATRESAPRWSGRRDAR
jgi:hypothetical protein